MIWLLRQNCAAFIVLHIYKVNNTQLLFYFYSTPLEIMIYSIAEKEHKMTRFARAQGSKVRFYGHFWCWLEDKYHKAKTNVLPPVAFVYNEVPNCRITVDTNIVVWPHFSPNFLVMIIIFYGNFRNTLSACNFLLSIFQYCVFNTRTSVAEPPLFWAAPARDVRVPGADSGSRQKKRRLRLPTLKNLFPLRIFFFK